MVKCHTLLGVGALVISPVKIVIFFFDCGFGARTIRLHLFLEVFARPQQFHLGFDKSHQLIFNLGVFSISLELFSLSNFQFLLLFLLAFQIILLILFLSLHELDIQDEFVVISHTFLLLNIFAVLFE